MLTREWKLCYLRLAIVFFLALPHASAATSTSITQYQNQLTNLGSEIDSSLDPQLLLQRLSFITADARRNLPLSQFNPVKKEARKLRAKIHDLQKSIRKAKKLKTSETIPGETKQDVPHPISKISLLNGTLEGTITDAENGSALQNVYVIFYTLSGGFFGSTYSDANGNYSTSVPAGEYFIRTGYTYLYVDELYDNFSCDPDCNVLNGTSVRVVEGSTSTADFTLDHTGSISGKVTDSQTGDPISLIQVQLYDASGNSVIYDVTDDSGSYIIENLIPGTYYARTLYAHLYSDQLYDHLPCDSNCNPLSGTPITVANEVTEQINFELIPWGTVTGTITDATTHLPISGAYVEFYKDHWESGALTDSSGYYTIQKPAGTYFARVYYSGYVSELYDDLTCMSCNPTSGKPISVMDGTTTPGIDFALEVGGEISGKVFSSSTGTPISGVQVKILIANGYTSTTTDSFGNYNVKGLATGIYYASTFNQVYIDEAYDGVNCEPDCDPTTATPIVVFAETTTAGIDFELDQGGSISGTVKDELTNEGLNSPMLVYDSNGNFAAQGSSDGSGDYTILGLAPGIYFIWAYGDPQHVGELYDNIPCPGRCDPLSGTPVEVSLGSNAIANFALANGGRIAGRVKDADTNSGIKEIEVDIYDSDGYYVTYGYTDGNGNYVTEAKIPTGTYYSVTYTDAWYLDEVYDNIPCVAGGCDPTIGTPISVSAPDTTLGINFTLTKGGSISGSVIDEITNQPISDISIDIYDSTGEWIEYGYSYSDSNGFYKCELLPPENCYATASDFYSYGPPRYIGELYNNFLCHPDCDVTTGTPIPVQDQNTIYVDFPLNPGGSISGSVSASNGQPLRYININVLSSNGDWVNYGITDALGNYKVPTLLTGSYYVWASGSGYVSELYDNVPCPAGACDYSQGILIDVTYGSNTGGINFQIETCPSVNVDPPVLPDGTTGTIYDQTIVPTGLIPPYEVLLGAGVIPIGLTLDVSGHLSGIPTFPGSYRFSVLAGNLDYCSGARTYDVVISGCAPVMVIPSTLPDGIKDFSYSQNIAANYGMPPINFTVTTGELPPGLTLDSSGLLSGNPTTIGSFMFTITAIDADGCTGSRDYTVNILSACLFCDNFDDGVISSDWSLIKPEWIEANGVLQGISTNKKAIISAEPGFSPGCSLCSIESSFSTSGGSLNSVWLLGWFQDKNNTIELRMKEETNKFLFKQRVDGIVVKKARAKYEIFPDQFYNLKMDFDGNQFSVFVDGNLLMTIPKASGSLPSGTVGFQVKNTTANFDFIIVH